MKHHHARAQRAPFPALSQLAIAALLAVVPVLFSPAPSGAQQPQPPAGGQAQPPAGQQAWPPAGCTNNCDHWVPTKSIDFSSRHNVLIRSQDGTLTPMDVPAFKSTLIAPGTWQILSDGDYSYLIEGDNEALAIDSTYGAGNIREYMETLTRKPVRYVANTHDHFDHTANDSYFDRAYMSAFTRQYATIPFASFAGMNFPRNYPITVIGDGYVFHLGNRDIEVFEVPNHTMGDLAYLDRKERILFSGDVFLPNGMTINNASSVARFAGNMRKLAAHRSEFDRLAGGFQIADAAAVDKYLANAEYILAGHEGDPIVPRQGGGPGGPGGGPGGPGGPGGAGGPGGPGGPQGGAQGQQAAVPPGTVVYTRHMPHPGDGGAGRPNGPNPNLRRMTYDGVTITYDIGHVQN